MNNWLSTSVKRQFSGKKTEFSTNGAGIIEKPYAKSKPWYLLLNIKHLLETGYRLNVRYWTIKHLDGSMGEHLSELGFLKISEIGHLRHKV